MRAVPIRREVSSATTRVPNEGLGMTMRRHAIMIRIDVPRAIVVDRGTGQVPVPTTIDKHPPEDIGRMDVTLASPIRRGWGLSTTTRVPNGEHAMMIRIVMPRAIVVADRGMRQVLAVMTDGHLPETTKRETHRGPPWTA